MGYGEGKGTDIMHDSLRFYEAERSYLVFVFVEIVESDEGKLY